MADISTPSDAQRLAALEAQLAEFQAAQQAKQAAEQAQRIAREKVHGPPAPEATPDTWGRRLQARQAARAAAGRQATAERDRAYEEQLERNRPKREKLKEQVREVNARMAAEQARCDAALGKLSAELRSFREKLQALEEMPPLPVVEPGYAADDKQFFATFGVPHRA